MNRKGARGKGSKVLQIRFRDRPFGTCLLIVEVRTPTRETNISGRHDLKDPKDPFVDSPQGPVRNPAAGT